MAFDISTALNIILFLALFPISFFWLRRAWRILFQRDFSEVALKHGEAPPNAERFAPWVGLLNLVTGGITATVVVLVVAVQLPFDTWTAIAGSTIWCKFMMDFGISRHAHGQAKRDAKRAEKAARAAQAGTTRPLAMRTRLARQRLLALFVAGLLGLNFPLLALWDRDLLVAGLPLFPLALFVIWGALIAALAWLGASAD